MLQHLIDSGTDDETALGNLIYLFEPAHFDLYSLWHWILHSVARNRGYADQIAHALVAQSAAAHSLIRGLTLETMRLAQSEVLYRQATSNIAFEGMLFPKDEVVRVCLWEGHKDEQTFPRPFEFKPERFLNREYSLNQFAPFGLDKYRCIGAELTMSLTMLFIEELLRNFTCEIKGDGPPQLGDYHWEPNANFSFVLIPRYAAS